MQQTGFREGMGTEVNILRILGEIQRNINKKTKETVWTLFIDLKSAFDKVDHHILMNKLKKMEVATDLVNTIVWLYE